MFGISDVKTVGVLVLLGTFVSTVGPLIGLWLNTKLNTRQHGDAIQAIKGLREDMASMRVDIHDVKADTRELKESAHDARLKAERIKRELSDHRALAADQHHENVQRLTRLEIRQIVAQEGDPT